MEDYKEKYEEALEKARGLYEQGMMPERIEYIFPELKESEDEKIRKEIIENLKLDLEEILCKVSGDYDERDADDKERQGYLQKAISWLEKQGSIGNINEKLRAYREYLVKETERWHKKEENKTLRRIEKQNCIGHANAYISARAEFEEIFDYESWNKKQGGQKPVDLNSVSIQKLVDIYRNTDEYDEDGNLKGKPVNCMIRAYEQGIRDILKTIKQKDVNHAWSEEDETMLKRIIDFIPQCMTAHGYNEYINWLKSLKERYTWKPSNEQMKALEYYIEKDIIDKEGVFGRHIIELYAQLKKLK